MPISVGHFVVDVAVVRREDMGRQVLHLAAALGAADGRAEAGTGEGIGQPARP